MPAALARRGSVKASSCSSVRPGTNPSGPNIFILSSSHGRTWSIAIFSESAICTEYPIIRSPPSSVSFPCLARVSCHRLITSSLAPPAAAPPPMNPLIPCLAMKSMAGWPALTIGCQHSTGRVLGLGTKVISSSWYPL